MSVLAGSNGDVTQNHGAKKPQREIINFRIAEKSERLHRISDLMCRKRKRKKKSLQDTLLHLEIPTRVQLGQHIIFSCSLRLRASLNCYTALMSPCWAHRPMRTCHCDGIKIPRLRIPFPLWGAFQMGARFIPPAPIYGYLFRPFLQSSKPRCNVYANLRVPKYWDTLNLRGTVLLCKH